MTHMTHFPVGPVLRAHAFPLVGEMRHGSQWRCHDGDRGLQSGAPTSKGTATVSKRPRGKPFQRGQSGNPGGRPKRSATVEAHKVIADVKTAARELTPQALGTLQEIMEDKKAPPAARVTAATEILSRGWGRPAQRLEAEAGNGTMSFLALVQASFSPEVEARARERMLLEGHAITDPERVS
jgi:hypothetical protein